MIYRTNFKKTFKTTTTPVKEQRQGNAVAATISHGLHNLNFNPFIHPCHGICVNDLTFIKKSPLHVHHFSIKRITHKNVSKTPVNVCPRHTVAVNQPKSTKQKITDKIHAHTNTK